MGASDAVNFQIIITFVEYVLAPIWGLGVEKIK